MHTPVLFAELLIIFGVSVPVAFLCLRLKIPLLVGLMLTGIMIGPYALGLIEELESIEILAEIGVMLLLFTIGLEFSLKRLRKIRRLVLLGGGLQVGLTIAVTAIVFIVLGRELKQALFFGFLAALSSTAIVLKSYAERNEINAPHGRAGVGVLLFQDVSIVLMMLLVPILGNTGASAQAVLLSLGTSLLALVVIVAASFLLIPIILKQIVSLRSPEVFLLTVVLLSFGTAWITSQFGLSLALGAFVAGVVVSESEYSHQITAEILPFRDVFNSLFFVSIGLLLSVGALISNIGTVLILVVCLIIGKGLIIWSIVRIMRFPTRVAVMTALGLAQVGEFSFVLAKAGKTVDLLPGTDYQIFLAASIISMIATPFLIAGAPRFAYFVQSLFKDGDTAETAKADDEGIHITSSGGLQNHVIVVGYGLNGKNLARVLRAALVPYTILELNGEVVRRAKNSGEKINYGDATRREVLKHAGIEVASAVVLAMSDPSAARRTIRNVRALSPGIYIIVRTRYVKEISELLALGADEVVAEEFETGIEIFSRVLQRYGVSRHVIEDQTEKIRRQGYEMLRTASAVSQISMDNLNAALHAATTETIQLKSKFTAIGRNPGELNIRGRTGATIIAVLRDGETVVNPGADYDFGENDTLVLLGESENISKAKKILETEDF